MNLWATWCGPCVQELPALVEMNRMYRGRKFEMATISLDEPGQADEVLKALQANHVAMKNYHFTGDGPGRDGGGARQAVARPGAVHPADRAGGKVLGRWSGAIEPLEVKRAIVEAIGRTYALALEDDLSARTAQEQRSVPESSSFFAPPMTRSQSNAGPGSVLLA